MENIEIMVENTINGQMFKVASFNAMGDAAICCRALQNAAPASMVYKVYTKN